jgi:hypothetical protein
MNLTTAAGMKVWEGSGSAWLNRYGKQIWKKEDYDGEGKTEDRGDRMWSDQRHLSEEHDQ